MWPPTISGRTSTPTSSRSSPAVPDGRRSLREHGEVLRGFTAATWDKNGGSCSATGTPQPRRMALDRGHHHGGDPTPIVQQQIGLGVRRPVHVLRVGQGRIRNKQCPSPSWTTPTRDTSPAHEHHSHTAWQRFQNHRHAGGGRPALDRRAPVRRDGDTGPRAIYLWGACLQQATIRMLATPVVGVTDCFVAAGIAAARSSSRPRTRGVAASDLRSRSNLADHRLIEVTARRTHHRGRRWQRLPLRRLMGAAISGWSGVIKVKSPAGVTAATSCSIPIRR